MAVPSEFKSAEGILFSFGMIKLKLLVYPKSKFKIRWRKMRDEAKMTEMNKNKT